MAATAAAEGAGVVCGEGVEGSATVAAGSAIVLVVSEATSCSPGFSTVTEMAGSTAAVAFASAAPMEEERGEAEGGIPSFSTTPSGTLPPDTLLTAALCPRAAAAATSAAAVIGTGSGERSTYSASAALLPDIAAVAGLTLSEGENSSLWLRALCTSLQGDSTSPLLVALSPC